VPINTRKYIRAGSGDFNNFNMSELLVRKQSNIILMKKLFSSAIFFFFIFTASFAQKAEACFDKGMEKANGGKLEEAIKFFDKSIKLKADDYIVWYNRGIAKSMLNMNTEALSDFEQTIKLNPEYKNGYLNRGIIKKRLVNYGGAMLDYEQAIKLDSNYAEAYYNRAIINEMLSKKDLACADFHKSKEKGFARAQSKIDKCNDTTKSTREIHSILSLKKTADNDKYGFTPGNPVKVGTGPNGGPANNRAYLDLLRDARGNPINYKRVGSCCPYPSKNGPFGMGMLDHYQITFQNEKGKKRKADVYISFYDYEEPQILFGFKTVE